MKITHTLVAAIGASGLLLVSCDAQKESKPKTTSSYKESWRFEIGEDKATVRDTVTGLIWARDANIGGEMGWDQAEKWVKTLNLGGATDWRLPTVEELDTIASSVPLVEGVHAFGMSDETSNSIEKVKGASIAGNLNGEGFTGVKARDYWSSTPFSNGGTGYRTVNMTDAFQFRSSRHRYVWPVRSEKVEDKNSNEAFTPLQEAAMAGQKDAAESLLAKKSDVNGKDIRGYTPLHLAAQNGHRNLVELLLANKADVDARNIQGYTPLHMAAKNGHKDVVDLLLRNAAVADARAFQGDTPLVLAVVMEHKEVVELLLANKADVNAKINRGHTPWQIATEQGHKDMADLLSQHGGHK